MTLTPEEKKAINTLKRLSKNWPDSLWLFSANGSLHVMRYGDDDEPAMTRRGGSVDQDYILDTINIPNDGGDF